MKLICCIVSDDPEKKINRYTCRNIFNAMMQIKCFVCVYVRACKLCCVTVRVYSHLYLYECVLRTRSICYVCLCAFLFHERIFVLDFTSVDQLFPRQLLLVPCLLVDDQSATCGHQSSSLVQDDQGWKASHPVPLSQHVLLTKMS